MCSLNDIIRSSRPPSFFWAILRRFCCEVQALGQVQLRDYSLHPPRWCQSSWFRPTAQYFLSEVSLATSVVSRLALKSFIPSTSASPYPDTKTVEEWTSILRLATKWNFLSLRELAVERLFGITSPIDRVVLSHTFGLPKWLPLAYAQLSSEHRQMSGSAGFSALISLCHHSSFTTLLSHWGPTDGGACSLACLAPRDVESSRAPFGDGPNHSGDATDDDDGGSSRRDPAHSAVGRGQPAQGNIRWDRLGRWKGRSRGMAILSWSGRLSVQVAV